MAEGVLSDRLDRTVDAILMRRDATAALRDRKLAPLARLAADLRHYPGQSFKARVRATLERRAVMSSAVISSPTEKRLGTITPYLRVSEPGLVDFLGHVFGAVEISSTTTMSGSIQREVRIGNSTIVIDEGVAPTRPVEFHVYVEDADRTFQRAVAAGAASLGEPADRPYGERAGFVRDPFGNHWFIATHRGDSYVPAGLGTLTPFVHAKDAAEYINFLKRGFAAVEEQRDLFGAGLVRFARLRIGNATIEIGEAEATMASMPGTFYLLASEVDRVYAEAVTAGARPLAPPTAQEQGSVARVEDPAGNEWVILASA